MFSTAISLILMKTSSQVEFFCQEFEEEREEEWKNFEPAPIHTQADELNDMKSLHRKLQETIVLLVKKQKDSAFWEAPHAEVLGTSETLHQV